MSHEMSKNRIAVTQSKDRAGRSKRIDYLMENEKESSRLDRKTDSSQVERHAVWAGLKPGMRVADLGCGSGKATAVLHSIEQPGGSELGLDISKERVEFAAENYGKQGLEFQRADIRNSLD